MLLLLLFVLSFFFLLLIISTALKIRLNDRLWHTSLPPLVQIKPLIIESQGLRALESKLQFPFHPAPPNIVGTRTNLSGRFHACDCQHGSGIKRPQPHEQLEPEHVCVTVHDWYTGGHCKTFTWKNATKNSTTVPLVSAHSECTMSTRTTLVPQRCFL